MFDTVCYNVTNPLTVFLTIFADKLNYKEYMPNMTMMLKLSDASFKAFEFLMMNFISKTVGRKVWIDISYRILISQIATPCDEAFTLLVLENCLGRWKENYKSEYGTDISEVSKQEEDDDDDTKSTYSKFTRQHGTNGEWTKTGMERFNELHGMVMMDRKKDNRAKFEELIMNTLQKKKSCKHGKRAAVIPDENPEEVLKPATNFEFMFPKISKYAKL